MAILSSGSVKMTSLLEKTVAIIAPHRCIICGNYNNILCDACVSELTQNVPSCCVLCGTKTRDWRVCAGCAPGAHLTGVWARLQYDDAVKELVRRFKFDHVRAAYKPIATLIVRSLPSPLTGWTVVPVPTVASHMRQRGYDHAHLVAKEVARLTHLPYLQALERTRNMRQVGATRQERAEVAESIALRRLPQNTRVLLIDDVCTTGATLKACAALLHKAGAQEVRAAVAAWQPPMSEHEKRPR